MTEIIICPNGGEGCDNPEPCEFCKYFDKFCAGCEAKKKHKEKEDERKDD